MRLLLDTHVFLWYITANPRLPASAKDAIRDPHNEVFLSAASVWEAVIKHTLGKLSLPEPPATYLPRQREAHQIATLPIAEDVLSVLADLPPLHRDPFDRILVAQAIRHGLTLVTADAQCSAYPVSLMRIDS